MMNEELKLALAAAEAEIEQLNKAEKIHVGIRWKQRKMLAEAEARIKELEAICELDIHIPDNLLKERDQLKERIKDLEDCKHPNCCCVCGHSGKCPECGPSIIQGIED